MLDELDDVTTIRLMLLFGIVMIIIGGVTLKNAIELRNFEDNATKEYVTGYVEEKAVRSAFSNNSYKSVFSFEYGDTTKQTIQTNKMYSQDKANRVYPIGTTKQIVIFNQDIRTARLDINSEKYHSTYIAYLLLGLGIFCVGCFLFVIIFDN